MARKASRAGQGAKAPAGKKNYCFGCGADNPKGMQLRFRLDRKRRRFLCRLWLDGRYTGPPGHCHGGIIATILDEAMSKWSKLHDTPAATSRLAVDYLRPVPLSQWLRVESRESGKRGRRLLRVAEIFDRSGRVLARGRGVFVLIRAEHVFRRR